MPLGPVFSTRLKKRYIQGVSEEHMLHMCVTIAVIEVKTLLGLGLLTLSGLHCSVSLQQLTGFLISKNHE